MTPSPFFRFTFTALLTLAGAPAWAVASAAPVTVRYQNPEHFTEARLDKGWHAIDPGAYLKPLQAYIVERATRVLPPGQRLDIVVTNVDRAGDYEPWRGPRFDDVRIVKDLYPPRIDLDFTLYGTDGQVLRSGSRKLRDAAFLTNSSPVDQDSLQYEKRLIDLWLRRGVEKL